MNRFTQWIALAVAAVTLTGGTFLAQQSSPPVKEEVALRAAIERETVRGDVAGAIEEYNKLAKSKDHSIAARALLRLAEAYERRGNAESRKVYEQIVREYPDQKNAVATAQARLGSAAALKANGTQQLVCSGPDCEGQVSPNGRLMVFNRDGVHVRNLLTREVRKIATENAVRMYNAEPFLWSPDSERLAYLVLDLSPCPGIRGGRGGGGRGGLGQDQIEVGPSVHIVRVDGAGEQFVQRDTAPLDWSADGKEILGVVMSAPARPDPCQAALEEQERRRTTPIEPLGFPGGVSAIAPPRPPTRNLMWINVASGAMRAGPTTTLKNIGTARVSPNGRHIAVSASDRVYIIASDGSSEVLVFGSDRVVARPVDWSPDGRQLLFMTMKEAGQPAVFERGSVWAVALSDGKPQGSPTPVISEQEKLAAASMTQTGVLHFRLSDELVSSQTRSTSPRVVYTASFDSAKGAVTSVPEILPLPRPENPSETIGGPIHLSPDGKKLLYTRFNAVLNTQEFSIYSIDNRSEQRIAGAAAREGRFCWSADASSIIFTRAGTLNQPDELVRINLKTNIVEPLLPKGTTFWLNSCSGDLISDNSPTVRIRNLKTGTETAGRKPGGVQQTNPITPSRLSHDGRSIAFLSESGIATFQGPRGDSRTQAANALFVAPVDGGAPKELVRARSAILPNEPPNAPTFAWSPDDRFVYYVKSPGRNSSWELFRVPAGGGPEQSTGLTVSGVVLSQVEFSLDGKRIVFSANRQTEIWAMATPTPTSK